MKIQLMPLALCPACETKERDPLYTLRDSKVFECRVCGLRYLDPCLSPDAMADAYESNESLQEFHDFHEGYYDYGTLDKRSRTRDDFERALALIEKRLGKVQEKEILDVGFGNGFFLALAKQRGWSVQGIDTSAQNVEIVRKKFGLELTSGLFEKEIPSDGRYDVVSFWDVIEHFPNPKQALNKAFEVLKPNGYVLIGVPHDKSFLMRVATSLYTLSGKKMVSALDKVYLLEHVSYYHKNSLDCLLRACGFTPRDMFFSSTDLRKYSLPWHENLIGEGILLMGKLLGMQNRMVGIYQKGEA